MNTKFWTKKNIIITIIVAIVILALVAAIVVISLENKEVQTAEASVTRGSLSTSINASGVVASVGINNFVPLFACVNDVTDIDSITEYAGDDFNWTYAFINSNTAPVVYEITYINPDFKDVKNVMLTTDEEQVIMEVMPYFIDWSKLEEAKDDAILEGKLSAGSTTSDFIFMLLMTNKDNPFDIPSEYLKLSTNANDKVTITTDYIKEIIEKATVLEESTAMEYTISNLTLEEGDAITIDQKLFKIAVSQLYTSFTVTEYDVAEIDSKLRAGNKVYAGVTINALGGRKVVCRYPRNR